MKTMKQEDDFEANLAGDEGQSEESKSGWFRRIKKGILTSTAEKKETPEGLWTKCPKCEAMVFADGTQSLEAA